MNIACLSEGAVKRFGCYESVHFEGKWYTNVELRENACRLGNALRSLGVDKGDRVIVQMPNSPPLLSAFSAIYRIGGVVVPLNPYLRPDQAAYIYRDSGAKVILTSSDYTNWLKDAAAGAPELEHIILADRDDIEGTLSYEKLLAEAPSELDIAETDNDDLAALVYTAGTTGNPKGVMHTHFSLYINSLALYEFILVNRSVTLTQTLHKKDPITFEPVVETHKVNGPDRNGTALGVLPLSHSYGIAFMNAGALVGGRSVMLRWWNPEVALKTIQDFKITSTAMVPTMYIQMLGHPDFDKYDLGTLDTCVCGSAPLPVEIAEQWEKKVGVAIREGWGMTETGATSCGQPSDRRPKYGSIGRPLLSCNTMKVFDESGREVPRGERGEIVFKGPTMMKGYWSLPEETAKAIRDGWLYTGDIGYVDEDGYFFITDRKKDIIIRGGENVSPREVEEVLYQHPAVSEAGVVGMPDEVYVEEVKAFVAPRPGQQVTEQEIIEFCKDKLPSYKRPKKVVIMDALPKNPVGKILRAELRKL